MKLFEMTRRPERAGVATVHYDRSVRLPSRVGSDIILPDHPELELYRLKNGRQLLIRDLTRTTFPSIYFCGTDEQPFLVQLKDPVFNSFVRSGQEGFYHDLQAPIVKQNADRCEWKRQGDFFALKLPFTLSEIEKANVLRGIRIGPAISAQTVEQLPMFRTRHLLTGQTLRLTLSGAEFTVVSGVLEAPDHRPMRLPDLWILEQADNLFDPVRAD